MQHRHINTLTTVLRGAWSFVYQPKTRFQGSTRAACEFVSFECTEVVNTIIATRSSILLLRRSVAIRSTIDNLELLTPSSSSGSLMLSSSIPKPKPLIQPKNTPSRTPVLGLRFIGKYPSIGQRCCLLSPLRYVCLMSFYYSCYGTMHSY